MSVSLGVPKLGVAREAQVQLGLGGLAPTGGDNLGAGVEVHAFRAVDVGVTKQGVLPATEGEGSHGNGNGDVNAHHAGFDVELEGAGGAAVASENCCAVTELVAVDQFQCLVVALGANHAEYGAEDLIGVDLHGRLDVIEQGDANEEAVVVEEGFAAIGNDGGAFGSGARNIGGHLVAVFAGDQRTHVGV